MITGFLSIIFLCVLEVGLAMLVVEDKSYPGEEPNKNDPFSSIFKY
ncbi:hypothetical protein [Pseudalkalibacillus decolorationis]|nr:hypothetical protein [Pseudalkalibacillus decolorationis]